jgi:1-acyl-sn-glycerol-3-phosphate acyltransferase
MFKPFTFRPPRNNRFFIALARRLLPLALRLVPKVAEVEVNEDDLKRLKELKRQRVVITPNHSGGLEPFVVFHLSKLLGAEFNYLAAKEAFERWPPIGWFAQRLGLYSIIRGSTDRNSFRMTRKLLAEGRRWLVIFPEGENCWQNDSVMPFQQGVAQLAFWAYEDMARQGELPPLYFVPTVIKYIYLKDMRPEIDRSLTRLERKLLTPLKDKPSTLYERLRQVGEAVLSINEKEYNIRPKSAGLNERLQHIKELIVSRVETAFNVTPRPEQPLIERIRDLFNAIDRIVYSEPEGEYERELHYRLQQEARGLYYDIWRETLTAERFLDVLGLLELEVFGRRRIRGQRKAIVKIGEPLNLRDYYPRYQTDKRGVVKEVTQSIESSVRLMLTGLSHQTRAVEQS